MVKSKPVEKRGRKAMGLLPGEFGNDCQAARHHFEVYLFRADSVLWVRFLLLGNHLLEKKENNARKAEYQGGTK
jgi:hypothetical protein